MVQETLRFTRQPGKISNRNCNWIAGDLAPVLSPSWLSLVNNVSWKVESSPCEGVLTVWLPVSMSGKAKSKEWMQLNRIRCQRSEIWNSNFTITPSLTTLRYYWRSFCCLLERLPFARSTMSKVGKARMRSLLWAASTNYLSILKDLL